MIAAAALSAGGIGGFAMTSVFCMKEILPPPRRNVKFSLVGTPPILPPPSTQFHPQRHFPLRNRALAGDAGGELVEGVHCGDDSVQVFLGEK